MANITPINFGYGYYGGYRGGYYGNYYGGYYDRRPYGPYDMRAPRYDGITDINRYRGRFPRYDGITDINRYPRRPHDYYSGWHSYYPPRRGSYGLPC